MLPLKPFPLVVFPLAGLEVVAVLFALEAGILAVSGLLVGACFGAGLREDFAGDLLALAGDLAGDFRA